MAKMRCKPTVITRNISRLVFKQGAEGGGVQKNAYGNLFPSHFD